MSWQDQIQKARKAFWDKLRQEEAVEWHYRKAAEEAKNSSEVTEELLQSLLDLANEMGLHACWAEANKLLALTHQLANESLGQASALAGNSSEMLSYSLMALQRPADAIAVMREAVRSAREAHLPNPTELTKRARIFAACLHAAGENIEAKAVLQGLIQFIPTDHPLLPALKAELCTYDSPICEPFSPFSPFDKRTKDQPKTADPELLKKANEKLGLRLRVLREAKEWSQEELAARVKKNVEFIKQVEEGEQALGLSDMSAVAEAFGLTTLDLVAVTMAQEQG